MKIKISLPIVSIVSLLAATAVNLWVYFQRGHLWVNLAAAGLCVFTAGFSTGIATSTAQINRDFRAFRRSLGTTDGTKVRFL